MSKNTDRLLWSLNDHCHGIASYHRVYSGNSGSPKMVKMVSQSIIIKNTHYNDDSLLILSLFTYVILGKLTLPKN